jgi:hypothetical protein
MVARVTKTSKCREKTKEHILAEEPKEIPPPYCTLSTPATNTQFHTLTSDIGRGSSRDNHTCKIWPRSLWGLNSPDCPESCGLQAHSESAISHSISPIQLGSPNQSLRGPLLSSDSYHSADAPEESPEPHVLLPRRSNTRRVDIHLPAFTTTDLLNWNYHIPSCMEKPQALIDLMQSVIQTHKPTWKDCQQLLLTLFNTEE